MKPPSPAQPASVLLALLLPFSLSAQGPPAKPAPADPAMAALEKQYAAERTSDLLAGLARYADELTALQKTLVAAGDTAGASRVQLEIDRLQPVLVPPAPVTAADDISIFDDAPPAPVPALLSADTATPADLESLLRALQPPASPPPSAGTGAGAGAGTPKPGSPGTKPGKATKRLLKMSGAQLSGSFLPETGYLYWTGPGRRAAWTLSDLPTTSCLIVLRYAADNKEGGGRLSARLGGAKVEVEVPSTGSWTRFRDLSIGPISISDSRADLVLEVASLKAGAIALMDLKAVMVIPSEP